MLCNLPYSIYHFDGGNNMPNNKYPKIAFILLSTALMLSIILIIWRKNSEHGFIKQLKENTTIRYSSSNNISNENSSSAIKEIRKKEITDISYKPYFEYIYDKDKDQALFSPEAFKISSYIYSELLSEAIKTDNLRKLQNKDYLSYKQTDGFKIINCLWMNEFKDIKREYINLPQTIQHPLNMSMPEATQIKNDYIKEQTNGFIEQTSTTYDPDTVFDISSILYFHEKWKGNSLNRDIMTFYNSDDSVAVVDGLNYLGTADEKENGDNSIYTMVQAQAYTLNYNNGFTITFILPKDGFGITDIDIDAFIKNRAPKQTYSAVILNIPEFTAEDSFEKINYEELAQLHIKPVNEDIYDKIAKISCVYTNKIQITAQGSKEVTEPYKNEPSPSSDSDIFYFNVNKPFVYFIKDTINDDIAFIGYINKLQNTSMYKSSYGYISDKDGIHIPIENKTFNKLSEEESLSFILNKLDKSAIFDENIKGENINNSFELNVTEKNGNINITKYHYMYNTGQISSKDPAYIRFAVLQEKKDNERWYITDYNIYNLVILGNNDLYVYDEHIIAENKNVTYKYLTQLTNEKKSEILSCFSNFNNNNCLKVIELINEIQKDDPIQTYKEYENEFVDWYNEYKGCIFGNG